MRPRFLLLIFALGLAGCSGPHLDPEPLGEIQDFTLQERSGRTVSRADLLGKVWVACFAFTRCRTSCPQISATMARLQHELTTTPDVRLVLFDVDPDHDTPDVLRRYADTYQADHERWLFLTGDRAQIYALIHDSFHLGVQQAEGEARRPGNEVIHSSRLAVVDRRGHVRGYFDGRQLDDEDRPVEDVPQLLERVHILLRERP
jgi:cytochrome oxidase Cu insertion factor (SCO1/SenC/PrrC family)